jgi:hypothetical protein
MDFTRRRAGEGDIVLIREAATYSPGSMIEVDGIPHEVARDLGDEVAPIAHCAAAVRGREVNGIPPGRVSRGKPTPLDFLSPQVRGYSGPQRSLSRS